nr:hypothetical protein [Maridesulfovibrio sp.]
MHTAKLRQGRVTRTACGFHGMVDCGFDVVGGLLYGNGRICLYSGRNSRGYQGQGRDYCQ